MGMSPKISSTTTTKFSNHYHHHQTFSVENNLYDKKGNISLAYGNSTSTSKSYSFSFSSGLPDNYKL